MKTFCLFASMLAAGICNAQTILKFGAVGGPSGSGTIFGQGTDITAKTVTFTDESTSALVAPVTTVTFSLSNQQFGPGTVEGIPTASALTFGNASNSLSDITFTSASYYARMDNLSSPSNAMFTPCSSCAAGSGSMTTSSYGVYMGYTTDAFINAFGANTQALNARIYMADLTITFSRPVTNPVLQLAGLGGNRYFLSGSKTYNQGFSAEFDLVTPGLSLSKLSGNAALGVSPTSITNSATLIAANSLGNTGSAPNGPTRYAASGSVLISGSGITSVTFKVYVRGDGGLVTLDATGAVTIPDAGIVPQWAASPLNITTPVAAQGTVSTDNFLVGVSLEKQSVALPVHLSSFKGTNTNHCTTQLDWETVREINTDYFEIQESENGNEFSAIGKVNAQNAPGGSTYRFTDEEHNEAAHYYRLLMVDFDGHAEYSNIIKMDGCIDRGAIRIYPNPAQDILRVEGLNGGEIIYLSNPFGQNIYSIKAAGSSTAIAVPQLSSGIYFITIVDGSGTLRKEQFIKN